MKLMKFSRTEQLTVANNLKLSNYLSRLKHGHPATKHSWTYENVDDAKFIAKWIHVVTEVNTAKYPEYADKFNQFEEKYLKKFGPQGEVPPFKSDEAQEALSPLYQPSDYDDEYALSKYFDSAEKFARELFGSSYRSKRPKGFKYVIDDMDTRDTLESNSGWPRYQKRKQVIEDEILDAQTGKCFEYPAVLLYRQYKAKLRPVWMYPMSMNLKEYTYSQVIQATLKESPLLWVRDYLSPWEGFEYVKRTLTRQWSGSQIDGGDTTKMDANMRPAQIRLVFEIVKNLFQQSYWDDLYKTMLQVNYIDLVVSDYQKAVGVHGLASGSGWTQLVETVLQLFMAWTSRFTGQGIGDDFVWLCNLSDVELVDYLSQFGLPANPEKQNVGCEDVTFLQRLFVQGFMSLAEPKVLGAYYASVMSWNSILHPEKMWNKKLWNSDMMNYRNIQIAENLVDDPCLDEFCKWLINGHRSTRSFVKKTDDQLLQVERQARLLTGLVPSYNREKLNQSITTFTVLRKLRELA